jgi:hypothetical protein
MPDSFEEQKHLFHLLDRVNFGDIDGMSDPNLSEYFVDRDYWNRIINGYKYFVVGRKGTGKSALYNWIKMKSYTSGDLVSNITFNEFPFQKLLQLQDRNFARPNQYQTICKNMILGEIASLIVSDEKAETSPLLEQLNFYVENVYGKGIQDIFRQTVERTRQSDVGLQMKFINAGKANEVTEKFGFSDGDLNRVNSLLQTIIVAYLKTYTGESKFIIQIDGIDENYNQIMSKNEQFNDYLQFVIGLLKSVYSVNQRFHLECRDIAKCLVYLRADIFYAINQFDAESARWEQQTEVLNWAIKTRDDWQDSDLKKVLNARIVASLDFMNGRDGFEEIFENNYIGLSTRSNDGTIYQEEIFQYIVNRTFHRPRDVIQFCVKIQDEARRKGKIDFKCIRNAEQSYSLWFLSEINNEISPNIKDTGKLFDFLRLLGSNPFSISTFKLQYSRYEAIIGQSADNLLPYLYDLGVVNNVNDNGEMFSIVRNERSRFNRDLRSILHPGFWEGLYTSTYSNARHD